MEHDVAPREDCARCGRPRVACYCAHLTTIATRTKVVVLQHPRERHKAIGTARIAALCLPSAEIVVGVDFRDDRRARSLLANPEAPAVLLYPSADARDLRIDPPRGPVTLVVVDGTWHHAKTLIRENPWLHDLPKVAFQPDRPSEYRIRREPREDYVSTIEAMVHALGMLEGDAARFQALLVPFRAMVDTQLSFAAQQGAPRKRRYRRQHADAASRLPPLLLKPNLLCVMGEANAWPHDRALGGPPYPHELVHACALRLADGMRLEHVVAPRLPLSASPIKHARLTEAALREGIPISDLRIAWNAFVQPDDVLCIWGHYATGLIKREDMPLPPRVIDIRKVVGDYLKARPGSAEDVIRKLGLSFQPYGAGRGGERLGMLVAITQWLVDAARQGQRASGDALSP
jgi:DTW domain-containing protein YfiP